MSETDSVSNKTIVESDSDSEEQKPKDVRGELMQSAAGGVDLSCTQDGTLMTTSLKVDANKNNDSSEFGDDNANNNHQIAASNETVVIHKNLMEASNAEEGLLKETAVVQGGRFGQ